MITAIEKKKKNINTFGTINRYIRNFNLLYIARFEASSKYVIIKCCLIKRCYTKN